MSMKALSLATFAVLTTIVPGQFATEAAARTAFDRAIRTQDAKLMLKVMRPREVAGVSEAAMKSFLANVVKPFSTGVERMNTMNSKNNLKFEFLKSGGMAMVVTNPGAKELFITGIIREGGSYRSRVGFAQLMFNIAAQYANSTKRNRIQEMDYAQATVEKWIPKFKALGIKGSIDPETDRYCFWDQIIRESRAEINKAKSPK
jgi:hypothetical protein